MGLLSKEQTCYSARDIDSCDNDKSLISEKKNSVVQQKSNSNQVNPPKSKSIIRLFSGWRTGAYVAAGIASVSLIINIFGLIWLQRHHNNDSGLVQLFQGECSKVSQMDIWIHLGINITSTLLLGGSNYCMQYLCAPTRNEVDRTHSAGKYLDIGVPSLRNLSFVGQPRRIMWWVLALSSLPLHLLYNSAIYSSIASNDYKILAVTPSFVKGASIGNVSCEKLDFRHSLSMLLQFEKPGDEHWEKTEFKTLIPQLQQQVIDNSTSKFHRLSPWDCVREYSQQFLQKSSNLILVAQPAANSSIADRYSDPYFSTTSILHLESNQFLSDAFVVRSSIRPFEWICYSDPDIEKKINVSLEIPMPYGSMMRPCHTFVDRIEAVINDWQPWGLAVQYCLAQQTPEHCSLNGNTAIMIAVVVANAVKIMVMLIVALNYTGNPLITIGDTIESFLVTPDKHTKGRCWVTYNEVKALLSHPSKIFGILSWSDLLALLGGGYVIPEQKTQRWSSAAGVRRWGMTTGLLSFTLVAIGGFLGYAIKQAKNELVSISSLGFGQTHATNLITGWALQKIRNPDSQIIAAIIVANAPQVILSFLYFNINALLTSMYVAVEWAEFAHTRQPLRVSTPTGLQRSTHVLHLPYKVIIPLLLTSGFLHWLLSKSLFLAVVAEYDWNGKLINPVQVASCFYSPMAMVCVLCVGITLLVAIVILGRRSLDPGIPLVGSCSIAIAAACHRPDWDTSVATAAIQWGAIPEGDNGIRHCCFTSGEVEPVQEGKLYR